MEKRGKHGKRLLTALAILLVVTGCSGGQRSGQQQSGDPQGRVLRVILDGAQNREAELEAVAAYLREIGIDAQVRIWEYNTLVEEARSGRREAYATDWGTSTFTPVDLAVPKLKTGERGNFSHYSNPEVDRFLDTAATTVDDALAREAYFRVQEIVHQDAPWIFGYVRDTIEASSVRVKNWRPAVDGRINLHRVSLEGGDTLVVGLRADRIVTLDPANHRDRETETVIRNMFDGLVTRTPEGEVVPELAESWSMSDDRTYLFHLRRGVTFHNGEPLTADDVVFTFNRILAPDGVGGQPSPRAGLLGPLESVEKVDDYTVKMTLSSPSRAFLQLLVHTQIIPEEYYRRVGFEGFATNPVGTGPFKFAGGDLSNEVVLERFERYWDGPPPLRKVVFRMIPEPAARVNALKAGEVHIIQEVPPDSVELIRQDPSIQVQVAEGTRLYVIELNTRRISDPRVRQALNYAINWDEILQQLYGGYAHRVPTAMLPSGFGYHDRLEPYPYDVEKARALLREAGYTVK